MSSFILDNNPINPIISYVVKHNLIYNYFLLLGIYLQFIAKERSLVSYGPVNTRKKLRIHV